MDGTIKIALVGAGMFGGDVHLRAYADLQRAGLSPQLGRVGLDHWARDLAPIKFQLVAVATRSQKSARRARDTYKGWTGHAPEAYCGDEPWLEVLRRFPDLDVLAVLPDDRARVAADEGIAPDVLAAFHGLEEERFALAADLAVGRERRFQIGQNTARHGDQISLRREFLKFIKCRRIHAGKDEEFSRKKQTICSPDGKAGYDCLNGGDAPNWLQ